MKCGPRCRTSAWFAVALVASSASTADAQQKHERVSVDSLGAQTGGVDFFGGVAISSDGRHVAFASSASDLVAGDTNVVSDVFVHDRLTGSTVRVSVATGGTEADGPSRAPTISADGRFVAFESSATDLVAADGNDRFDVFAHDRDPDENGLFDEGNGVTLRISEGGAGEEGDGDSDEPSISGDGTRIAFTSRATNLVATDLNGKSDVFVRDLVAGTTTRVSVDTSGGDASGDSNSPSISSDGSAVAFISAASDLVGADTNGLLDVFVLDFVTGLMSRVSVDSTGGQGDGIADGGTAISADGSVVAFGSFASDLVSGDTNGDRDVFVHDRTTGITSRVSVDSSGREGTEWSAAPALSADGQIVAFESFALLTSYDTGYFLNVYVRDRAARTTTVSALNCVDQIDYATSARPSVSGDGRFVAFASDAARLVAGDTNGASDAFVEDRDYVPPIASWTNYGAGYPGALGIPTLVASANPVIGTGIDLEIASSAKKWTIGFLLVGFERASIPTNDGGTILVDVELLLLLALPPWGATLSVDIPVDVAFCGITADLQVLEVDPGALHGVSFTPGLELATGW